FTDRKNSTFDDKLKMGQFAAKALAKPLEGLKSRSAEERLMTTAVLLYRYRWPRQGVTKTEPIPAQESKLILTTLAELDWASLRRLGFAFRLLPPLGGACLRLLRLLVGLLCLRFPVHAGLDTGLALPGTTLGFCLGGFSSLARLRISTTVQR